jgi:pimeloyl-ACP methyl ester carboxylesterase
LVTDRSNENHQGDMMQKPEQDAVVPPAWSAALAATLDAVVTTLPGAGHCPQVTRAADVNALIRDFATGIETEGAAA